jgi:pimeloyl-ACP methyl ester carboxylesterase
MLRARLTASLASALGIHRLIDPETLATLREALLLPRDLGPIIPPAASGDDVVVLVHGFLASAGVFRPMRTRLEQEGGVRVATFSHAPGFTVGYIARQLASVVDRLPRGARVHVLGHSLGGVIARYYVQELGGHTRVTQTISLGSPFGGSIAAERLPVLVGGELHPKSALLERLRAGAHRSRVPHTSIIGGADRIVATESARFATGEAITLHGRGHNALLFDEDVMRHILALLGDVTYAAA